jgi:hypothetical protein
MWRSMYVVTRTAFETLSQAKAAPRVARVPLSLVHAKGGAPFRVCAVANRNITNFELR